MQLDEIRTNEGERTWESSARAAGATSTPWGRTTWEWARRCARTAGTSGRTTRRSRCAAWFCDLRFENARLREKLDAATEETAAPKATKLVAGAVKDARLSIETVYKVSRERALALTKLDECEMWLGRCEPKETAAPMLRMAVE